MKKIALAAALLGATAALPAAAQVYSTQPGLTGNQNWQGTLGLNFTVNAPVLVSAIGVFDSGSDGLGAELAATIYNSAGVALFTPVTFSAGTANSGNSAYLFQSVTPLLLNAGTYQIAAWGYGSGLEANYNQGFVAPGNGGPIVFDTLGGRLTAVSSSYLGTAGVFATIPDNGNTRYGAGSFIAAAVPEPATWGMMLLGFGMIGFGLRRRPSTVRTTVRFA